MTRRHFLRAPLLAVAMVAVSAPQGLAQGAPNGYVSLFADFFPNRQDTAELRARVFLEQIFDPTPRVLINASGFAEGLLARRPSPAGSLGTVRDGTLRVHDLNVLFTAERFDLLAGYARTTWGTLDEIQPTDVINPLDVSRFFFEGRNEARLPVLLARGRLHVTTAVTVEGVYLPGFRRGRFDQLDEPTSPFNLQRDAAKDPIVCQAIGCPAIPPEIAEGEPAFTAGNSQGGARVSVTTGRVDWSVSAFRGFEAFALYVAEAASPDPAIPLASLTGVHPRFTMIGGDFEAVRGEWGIRGELAAFVADNFQSPELRVVTGSSIDAGVGVDRRAGAYTVSATVLVHSESYETPLEAGDGADGRSDVSLVGSADRTFARERYRLRAFGVYNATEASGFVRGIGTATLRDNVSLEGSAGWFLGDGRDLVGRFGDSDFAYVRLKYFF